MRSIPGMTISVITISGRFPVSDENLQTIRGFPCNCKSMSLPVAEIFQSVPKNHLIINDDYLLKIFIAFFPSKYIKGRCIIT